MSAITQAARMAGSRGHPATGRAFTEIESRLTTLEQGAKSDLGPVEHIMCDEMWKLDMCHLPRGHTGKHRGMMKDLTPVEWGAKSETPEAGEVDLEPALKTPLERAEKAEAQLEEARGLLERVAPILKQHCPDLGLNVDIDAYLSLTKPVAKSPTPAVNSNLDPLCSCDDRYGHMEGIDPDCPVHGLITKPEEEPFIDSRERQEEASFHGAPKEAGGLVEEVEKAIKESIVAAPHTDWAPEARAAIAATADWLEESMPSWDAGPVCASALRDQLGDSK